eukprot:747290-Hanusia_phi.AAC.3
MHPLPVRVEIAELGPPVVAHASPNTVLMQLSLERAVQQESALEAPPVLPRVESAPALHPVSPLALCSPSVSRCPRKQHRVIAHLIEAPVGASVLAVPVAPVLPVAPLVHVAVGLHKHPLPLRSPLHPLSLVLAPIHVRQRPMPVPEPLPPCSLVPVPVAQCQCSLPILLVVPPLP